MEGALRNIGLQPNMMNPAMNNMPLMFNNNKGKPLITTEERREEAPSSTTSQDNPQVSNPMLGGGMMSMGFPSLGYPGPMMGHDPNMNNMSNMSNMNNMMMMGPMMGVNQYGSYMGPVAPGMEQAMSSAVPREIITLKSCSLYPPPPGTPPRTHREKPPGCRTIFIGGLPDTTTEEILTEVFESCGPITSIRLSKKNFAHIRFQMLESTDRTLFISGYRMKIENKDDKPNTGRIHVDYAVARDDQYEFECHQRAFAREMRHRMSIEEARLRPPSPPPVIHFNDHEASVILDQLKSDDNFIKASITLTTWLERGDCVRRTSNTFFSMIQASNSHVRRLLNEKQQFEEELQQAKLNFSQQVAGILKQFDQIDKIFDSALKQRCWDHFSKAQRKSIELWNKQAKEIHLNQQEEFLNERVEDEMDLSDQEGDTGTDQDGDKTNLDGEQRESDPMPFKRKRTDSGSDVQTLKEENDSLKCQLEGYKNEIDLVKQDLQTGLDSKDIQLKALQKTLQGMQKQLLISQKKLNQQKAEEKQKKKEEDKSTKKDGEEVTEQAEGQEKEDEEGEQEEEEHKDVITINDEDEEDEEDTASPDEESKDNESRTMYDRTVNITPVLKVQSDTGESTVTSSGINLNPKEAKLLGLICCFLHVHPFGATVDYLWSYLNQLEIIKPREVEDLLERFPMLFKQIVHGVGASIERRWNFCGYSNLIC